MKRLLLLFLLLPGMALQAAEQSTERKKGSGLGFGYAVVRFDTNVKFTNKATGRPIFVDAEGTLGLPKTDAVPILYGSYKFSPKHGIGFSYFRVNRKSSVFNIDENLDDVRITGEVRFRDDTEFLNLFYSRVLFSDDRSSVRGLIGINLMDIRYELEAEGTIEGLDAEIRDELREDTSILAPLPLLGLDLRYQFTPKWSVHTKVSLVAGSYEETKAWVLSTAINSTYRINENIGVVLGLSYFDADIDINEKDERTEINYGYDGLFIGLHGLF
jgi:hypothetical protein